MPSAQRTITIERQPDLVYAFFTDHGNDPKWRPNVVEIEPISGAPVGKRIHQVIKGRVGEASAPTSRSPPTSRPPDIHSRSLLGRSAPVAISSSRRRVAARRSASH